VHPDSVAADELSPIPRSPGLPAGKIGESDTMAEFRTPGIISEQSSSVWVSSVMMCGAVTECEATEHPFPRRLQP